VPLRALENTNRTMQRLGYLKFLVYRCSMQDATTVSSLGKALIEKVTKKKLIQLTPELKEYIQKRLTDSIYRKLREAVKKINVDDSYTQSFSVELQDFYLASKKLASKTGKLVSEDWRKYPYLTPALGLVRKESYSLLVRGKVFLEFISSEEIESFNKFAPEYNPFYLNLKQKIIMLFSLLENDGDVLKLLYSHLIQLADSFSDREAGDFLPEVYRNVASYYNSKTRSGDEKDRLFRLLKSAESIEKWKGKPYSGKGAREEDITVRLEPYVDLSLITKQDPFRYEYGFSDKGKLLFRDIVNCEQIDSYLSSQFFNSVNQAFSLNASEASDEKMLKEIFQCYQRIKSTLGYAPIKELALMAGIKLLTEQKEYIEIGRATQFIMQYQKDHPYDVRFQVDRSGAPVYIKFLKNIYIDQ